MPQPPTQTARCHTAIGPMRRLVMRHRRLARLATCPPPCRPHSLMAIRWVRPITQVLPTDFGKLTLSGQMATMRQARVLFGMHGAG